MNSRERVLAALNHQEPDRVPVDLGGTVMSGIMALALDRLQKHLGIQKTVKVYEVFQMLGEVELDLAERFAIDTLPVEPQEFFFELKRDRYKPWTLFDGTEVLVPGGFVVDIADNGDWLLHTAGDPARPIEGRMPKNGYYFDMPSVTRAVPNWSPPDLDQLRQDAPRPSEEAIRFLGDHAAYLRKHTDKALILTGNGWWGLASIGSLPDQLMLIATNREYVRDLLAMRAELGCENLRCLWEVIGDTVDIVMIDGQDFGTQRSEMFSPRVFEELFAPSLAAQVEWIHQHTSWKVWQHTCGSIVNILPSIVKAGVDAINPVQTSATGMDPCMLKAKYGYKITFWGGGIDTQRTLPFGTPDDVRKEVGERIQIFAPGGGFVFAAVHNIQANTPPENILAMFEAVKDFGTYPVSSGVGQ